LRSTSITHLEQNSVLNDLHGLLREIASNELTSGAAI